MADSGKSPRAPWILLGLLFCLWSCFPVQTRTEEFLEWNLPDSLTTFDKVEIVILDAADSTLVLDSIYSGKLAAVRDLQPYALRKTSGRKFLVRVRGFRSGSLVYQTDYVRQGDTFRVQAVPRDTLAEAHPFLTALSVSPGNLAPSFSSGTLEYRLSLPFSDSAIRFTATASGSQPVTVAVDTLAPGIPGRAIPVKVGEDTLKVAVHGSGVPVTYRIMASRARSPDARLRSLSFSDTTLSISFNSEILEYSLIVSNPVDSLTLLPTTMDPQSEVTVNGFRPGINGRFPPFALSPGANKAEILVVAPDGASRRVYVININRMPSTNAYLSVLTISPGSFSKPFQRDKLLYNVVLPAGPTEIGIVAIPEDALASVKVNNTKAQGNTPVKIPLTGTMTIIYVVVSAADTSISKSYIMTISGKPAAPP